MRQRYRLAALAAIVTATLAAAGPASGQSGGESASEPPASPQTCLEHTSIRRTKVLNDRNILFTTRTGQSYNNALPRECPSLQRGSLVNYGVVGGRLCAGSSFQVLWRMGLDLVPTFLCQLGAFVPITEAEMEDLVAMTDQTTEGRKKRRRSSRDMVTATPVETTPGDPGNATEAPDTAANEAAASEPASPAARSGRAMP